MSEFENIVLHYPVKIKVDLSGESNSFIADRCEFFIDEHEIQWVKFVARNGYDAGKEHMLRTDSDGFMVVRT